MMGIAPGYAMPQAIKRAGLKLADMDVLECNEAFAVQNLAVIKEIEKQTGETVDLESKWNPNGTPMAGRLRMATPTVHPAAESACSPCGNSSAGEDVTGSMVPAAAAVLGWRQSLKT